MISLEVISSAMYEAMRLAATNLPPDIEGALMAALEEETDPLARRHMQVSLENARAASEGEGLVCADTGFPLFFLTAGSRTAVEGGFGALSRSARDATARATAESFLRPTMVDPLTRQNPGNNLGPGMPKIELRFEGDGDGLDIIAAPKGGGSEIFGTFYRMMYPSDGEAGILKFAIDTIRDGCYAGKICPPAIVGVGIGGTADLCMKLAKEAALLRPVRRAHPDPRVAAIEKKLYAAARALGLGPMGSAGINSVLAVHVDTAMTHTAALPVAVNAQCLVGRRWRAMVSGDGQADPFYAVPCEDNEWTCGVPPLGLFAACNTAPGVQCSEGAAGSACEKPAIYRCQPPAAGFRCHLSRFTCGTVYDFDCQTGASECSYPGEDGLAFTCSAGHEFSCMTPGGEDQLFECGGTGFKCAAGGTLCGEGSTGQYNLNDHDPGDFTCGSLGPTTPAEFECLQHKFSCAGLDDFICETNGNDVAFTCTHPFTGCVPGGDGGVFKCDRGIPQQFQCLNGFAGCQPTSRFQG